MTSINADRILKVPDLLQVLQVSRATLYRLRATSGFPQPHRLGTGRAVRWLESEVNAWMASFRVDDGDDY